MWRLFKTAHSKVDDFREGRTRQPDDEFLRDCGVEPGTEAARVALAVRRAVAGVGLVDPLFVRAGDSFPGTLEALPIWDSMDWLTLAFELERELGHRVLRSGSGDLAPRSEPLTVRGLATRVLGLLGQGQTAEPTSAPDPGA